MALLTLVDDIVTATTNVQPAAATTYVLMGENAGSLYDGATTYSGALFAHNPYGGKISINNSYYYRTTTNPTHYSFVSTTTITSITRAADVAQSSSVNFQPSAATFWIIDRIVLYGLSGHNLTYNYYDGTNTALINGISASAGASDLTLLLSNSYYLRISETGGSGGAEVILSGKQTPSGLNPAVTFGSLAASGSTTIQPASGNQYIVLSAGAISGDVAFYKYDGVTSVTFFDGGRPHGSVPLTNSDYLRILNGSGGTRYYAVGYLQDM